MPIDYFSNCKTTSNKQEFGLCDDQPPASNPAYIDEIDSLKWIAKVKNKENKEINFNAIDNCIDIRRDDGTMDSRCDGLLSFENDLIFIELKERKGRGWLKKGREQLTATILRFKQECDITKFSNVKGFVCNSLKPLTHSGQFTNIQKFKDCTGFKLEGKANIEI